MDLAWIWVLCLHNSFTIISVPSIYQMSKPRPWAAKEPIQTINGGPRMLSPLSGLKAGWQRSLEISAGPWVRDYLLENSSSPIPPLHNCLKHMCPRKGRLRQDPWWLHRMASDGHDSNLGYRTSVRKQQGHMRLEQKPPDSWHWVERRWGRPSTTS